MRRDGLGWRRMAGLGAQEGEMRLGALMQIFRRVGGGMEFVNRWGRTG